jgi:amidohydrolase
MSIRPRPAGRDGIDPRGHNAAVTAAAVTASVTDPTKQQLAEAVQARRSMLLGLSHRIHANPEPGFEEVAASAAIAEILEAAGFAVEHPAGSLPTAIRARLPGGNGRGPRVAILAEYDALRGLGHGCGHNIIATAAVGAALALASVRALLPGEIVFLGTPAEEDLAGKQVMLDDGLFEDVDAAMMVHPSNMTHVEVAFLASVDAEVVFTGAQAHASSDPWQGRNALDALLLLLQSIGLWRQQLRPDARVHGIITDGGQAVNIIPARAAGHIRLRSADQAYHAQMQDRLRAMVEAAANAARCEAEVRFFARAMTMRHNSVLGARFAANLAANGVADGPMTDRLGSSDIGNVSFAVPTIHPMLAITDEPVPLHSVPFRDLAVADRGDAVALLGATALAQTAFDVLTDPGLVERASAEFHAAAGA